MPNAPNELKEVLIVRITPQFLERGPLWFKENLASIKKSQKASALWKDAALILEKDLTVKPSELLRKMADFGYEKTGRIFGRGEFVWQGNVLEVWPINMECPVRIEFFGNTVEEMALFEREAASGGPKVSFRASLEKLPPGSFVVHLDHGIGLYRGQTRTFSKQARTYADTFQGRRESASSQHEYAFYAIEYAPPRQGGAPDMLYVPRSQAKKLSPYIGFDTPTIHRLGGTVWVSIKRKAKEAAEKLAGELMELYKKRLASKRPPYQINKTFLREFDEKFGFEETDDQKKAAADIDADFSKPRPMDRIICGDVGFGKTEIAQRAAFRTVMSGKQAALISPTTILADQHLRNFKERFAGTGAVIAGLSRLTPKKEAGDVLSKLKEGGIDIVVGTHRLLSRDIAFKNPGLAIIDEEQKFGVRQKERFKEMRSEIDVLSLSATPIPRTLQFALSKLRDISLIETPPKGRVAIKTYVLPRSKKLVKEAVLAELGRGGQIYVLHNRVQTMNIFQDNLQKLLPGVKMRRVHGRINEKALIETMDDFRNKKFEVLVATTIIENGLDFPNVNTLLVEDAAKLGLAQAHQIRGRIGRGDKQAYAYFLYPSRNLTAEAMERLAALQEFSELGSGYEIALRDLEIRGAGNILGKEQSGAVNKVGFNLYCQLLNETLEELTRHQ